MQVGDLLQVAGCPCVWKAFATFDVGRERGVYADIESHHPECQVDHVPESIGMFTEADCTLVGELGAALQAKFG